MIREPSGNPSQMQRNCDAPKVVAWSEANGGTALPELLSESTYSEVASLAPGSNAIRIGTASNYLFAWRPSKQAKLGSLIFASAAGVDGNTSVWELGAYAAPYYTSANAYLNWTMVAKFMFTVTLGSNSVASQTADPWQGLKTFASTDLRFADTLTYTYDSFGPDSLSICGYGAVNVSGRLIVDYSFATLFVMRNTTKSAAGTMDMWGVVEEVG